ncbi:A disintegrin and metalloproteinase with thrombospondin motifs adt-1-like [Mya arenaria]|uniref:A disintegrin and metalloproteinase with thrombospondin motifs adt-1-like n=1 Tax=Mya arenaria TaxID=6604 RepID=UPI0022E0F600|nr:A disintegrin and metalloproteinase with thrombospondin motifs adt-1-like [Mya arenaria]
MGENVTRPVRCLECDMAASPDDCTTVKQCGSNEVCFAQKFHTFGNIRYRMGCMDKQYCDTHPRAHVQTLVGRRATDDSDCDVCCMQDHCNIDSCSQAASTTTYQLNSLSPNNGCQDKDETICATFGRLSPESCKETSVVNNCPKSCDICDHVGWSSWQSWGKCSSSCGPGTKHRTRNCIHRVGIAAGLTCTGSHSDSSGCNDLHCPIHGGWCYQEEKYNCRQVTIAYSTCDTRTVKTTCGCPRPQYGGNCF